MKIDELREWLNPMRDTNPRHVLHCTGERWDDPLRPWAARSTVLSGVLLWRMMMKSVQCYIPKYDTCRKEYFKSILVQ